MTRSVLDYLEAKKYLVERFGADRVSLELITTQDGYCTGCIFKVGRSKHVAGSQVNSEMLRLFADGIEYSDNKRKARADARLRSTIERIGAAIAKATA